MRVSDAIWQRLAQEVEHVFYLPGGGCGPLVDALGQSGLRSVCTLHEQGAGFAAVAYAQYRGFGVALVTSGPGATNIMTPCLAAWVDSVPLLIISGQVMTRWLAMPGMRSRGTQEGPTAQMFDPITKGWAQPHTSDYVMFNLERLIGLAKEGRPGPVLLDVPMDIQGAML
jgi:acetolactate synthase I/II/III large subunit